jgi:hypothetical protein
LERVACFIPFLVVFTCDNVQEIAAVEGEVPRAKSLFWWEIGEGFDHLFVACLSSVMGIV